MSTVDHCNVFSRRGWRVAALKQPGSVQRSMRKTYEAKIPIIFSICWPHFTSSMLNSVRLLSLHVPVGWIAYPVFPPVFKNVFGLGCAQDWKSIWPRAAEYNDKSGEMENWVFVNQVIQINLLLLCEQHGVYINKKKKKLSLCPYSMLGGRSLCFTALYCLTRRGKKKTKYPVSFSKSHNALFPPSLFTSSLLWIWAHHSHCHAGWKNILHDSSSFFYPDRIQRRKGFIQEKRKRA